MKRFFTIIMMISMLIFPVSAMELTAPTVPESGREIMPDDTESFGEGLWEIAKSAISALRPELAEACRTCLALFGTVLLLSLFQSFSGMASRVVQLVAALMIAALLLSGTNSLIHLAAETVVEISEYGKLLLPVMTAGMAAQGSTSTSAALYAGTALFDAALSTAISKILVPMVYVYLALAVANSAMGEDLLKKLQEFVKWLAGWCLKTILTVFTGYMGITGVVSGTADAAALKATKMTISSVVPVVGGILSEASEAVLVGAGLMKSAAGVYGLLAIASVWIGPFLKIGIQYLLLKLTGAVCGVFGTKQASALIQDFSSAMGLLLAMTGSCCLLLVISTICFMKGAG